MPALSLIRLLLVLTTGLPLLAAQFALERETVEPEPIPLPVDERLLTTINEMLHEGRGSSFVVWSGTVVDVGRRPIQGIDVWVYPDGSTLRSLGRQPRRHAAGGGAKSPGNSIVLDEISLDDLPRTTTAADGRFQLGAQVAEAHLPRWLASSEGPGTTYLVFSGPGWATRVECGFERSRDERLVPKAHLGEIVLARGRRVRGTVLDENGRPVEGATIRLAGPTYLGSVAGVRSVWQAASLPGLQSARSDAEGGFELQGLWPAKLELVVEHPRLALQFVGAATEELRAHPFVMRVALGASLAGRVVDSRGHPVEGAFVSAPTWVASHYSSGCCGSPIAEGDDALPTRLLPGWNVQVPATWTDASGRFQIDGLGREACSVQAMADGFEPTLQTGIRPPASDPILTLPDEAQLDIRLLDGETGRPVADALVRAVRRQTPTDRKGCLSTTSDVVLACDRVPGQPGFWRARGAGRVRTQVFVAAPGREPRCIDVEGLRPGDRTVVEVRLRPGPVLRGQVTSAGGMPLAGVVAHLTRPDDRYNSVLLETQGHSDGSFSFPSLVAGTYDLIVKAPGHAECIVPHLEVGPDPAALKFVAARGACIEGRVLDSAGQPDWLRTVALNRPPFGRIAFGQYSRFLSSHESADEEGRFRWDDVPPGRYRIEVERGESVEVVVEAGDHVKLELRSN